MPMESKSTPSSSPKTKIDQFIDGLFAYLQRQWWLVALVILYIFFHPTFESKFVALLQSFAPSWVSFIVWCGIIVTALAYTYVLCRRRYVISEGVLSWTAFLLLGWAYYRLIGVADYVATPTRIPGICYVDFLPFCGGCMAFVVWWSHRYRTKPKQEGMDNSIRGYEVECPCTSEDEDLLGRRKEAEDLAEKIFKTDTSNAAFTLGLTAPWGAGKTSFMLAMKDYLEKRHSDETILLDFNPWMYRKAPNLTQVFFEELSRTLAPYNSALASGFIRYVDHILDRDDSAWLQLGVRLLPQGFKAKSTSEQYEFLKKEIGKLGRKIMIFIDDVDRLDSEELIELFSLIRNSSLSFPHMSYILAYDKEYVASQLQSKFNEHTYRYMEKIVQAEYPLAKITPEPLKEAFTKELVNVSPTYNRLATHIISSIKLEDYLPTLRAIKQICNALSSRRKELEGNVSLFDWFIIELIRIQYPRLFDFLRENYRRVFYAQGDKRLIRIEEALADHPSYGSEIDFYKHISEHHKSLQIKSVDLVTELLLLLWGEARDAEVLQANHGDYIGRYFYGTLCASEIDETEFQKHIALPFEEIKEYVKQKINLMQEQDLYRKIKREHADSREKAEKLLRTVFYLASSRLFFTRTDFDDQVNKLNKYLNWEDKKSKLMEIFEQPDIRLGVLLYLIMATRYIEEPSFDSYTGEELITLPFSLEVLEEKKVRLFMKYLAEHKSRNLGFCYILWRECRTFKLTGQQDRWGKPLLNPVVRHPQMDKEMKQAIQENLEAVIPYFIARHWSSPQDRYVLLLPEPIWELYTDDKNLERESFCNFINQQDSDSSPVIKEFQEFLKRWIENKNRAQFDNYDDEDPIVVGFRFNHIEPKGWESLFRNEDCKPRNYPEDESTEMY